MNILIWLTTTRYMQYLSATIAMLSMASVAMHLTWPSPTLPKLTSDNSPIGITITDEEGSWIASSFLLGTLPGYVLAGWFVEKFGRKAALLLSALPLTLPWIVIVFAESTLVLCIFRFIGGAGLALVTTSAPMYNGEISEKDIRGKLGTTFNILRLTGNLYVLSVGPFVSYTALALSCIVLPITFLIVFFFMPESPYYLIKAGKMDAARKNLVRLSSGTVTNKTIDDRLEEMKMTIDHDMRNRSTLWEVLLNREYRKSLLIMAGIKSLQQLCGITAIEAYTQTIIEASDSSISAEISSIIAGVIQFPAVLITAAIVDKVGRKPLLIISALGCAVALIGEGIYFYLRNVACADVTSLSWLPTTGLMLYLLMNPVGLSTLPWILISELFAINIKGVAVSVSSFYGSALAFLVTKFFQPISNEWGMHVTFWMFAAICILGAIFVFFVIPETKGKTFAEIQEALNPSRKTKIIANTTF